jgi:hypothetical protein
MNSEPDKDPGLLGEYRMDPDPDLDSKNIGFR